MTTETLAQARDIVRRLSVQEKLYLLNDITAQLIRETTTNARQPNSDFPVFHVAQWPEDLPMRREELYDDRGR